MKNDIAKLEKELYKDVEKVELSKILPNRNFPPGFDYGVVDERGNILNFCSKKYNLVHNKDVFLPVEREMENRGIAYEKKIRIIHDSKFLCRLYNERPF